MVKVNELRVGNLLNYDIAEGDVVTATIDWQDIQWISQDPKGFNLVHNPIPLTEEWLIKLGFKKHIDTIWIHWSKESGLFQISTRLPQGSYGLWVNGTIGCFQYVHQLQNIHFALTGGELETRRGK